MNGRGIPLSDIAVVFPALRDELGLIEEVFSDSGYPGMQQSVPGFHQPVVQFFLEIANLVANGYARENIIRLIRNPFFRRGQVPGGSTCLDAAEVDLVSRYAGIDGPYPEWKKQLAWLHQELVDPEKGKNFRGISLHSVERVQEGMEILLNNLDLLSKKKRLRDHIKDFQGFLNLWDIPYLFAAPNEHLKEQENPDQ